VSRRPAGDPSAGTDPTGAAFTDAVITVLEALAPGEVIAYGEIAAEAGYPGAARAVGNLLRRTPGLPWWRVVTATGRLVPHHEAEQAEMLRAEGVEVWAGRVRRPSMPSRGSSVQHLSQTFD
jgi:methylated-DNA-protein-cysteine methyltransferase-like protein